MKMDHQQACFVQQIGTAVPERSLNVEQAADYLKGACINTRSAKLLQRIVRLTGIESRHLAALDFQDKADESALFRPATEQPGGPGMGARTSAFDRAAGPLVLRALSAFSPDKLASVRILVTASCTHASAPGLERPILSHTPVPLTVDRWNLGFMGCSAGLAAIRLLHRQPLVDRPALVVACELSSLHLQYTDELDQMTANLLFADGAAGLVLSAEPSAVRVVDCCSVTAPDTADHMVWYAGDHGLQLRLSQELPDTLAAHLPGAVDQFLLDHGLRRADVNHWLVHPGGAQILDAVQESLRLPAGALNASRAVYRQYGNMSSPTIFFILKAVMESNVSGWSVAMAFGPGLTIELVLLRFEPDSARAGT